MTNAISKYRYFVLAVIIALAGVFAAAVIVSARPTVTHRALGAQFAEARIKSGDDVILRVNGYPVSNAEVVERRARFNSNLGTMKSVVSRVVPVGEWTRSANFDINDPSQALPEFMVPVDDFKARIEVMEKHGTDAVVLAGIVLEYATFSAAVSDGYKPTKEEVTEFVAQLRQTYEQHSDSVDSNWGFTAELKAYIEEIGEDKYWSEVYPLEAERRIAVVKWQEAAINEDENVRGRIEVANRIRTKLERSSLADAKIEVVDASKLKATPEEAKAYLNDLWEATAPPEPTPTPVLTPKPSSQ